MVLARKAIPGGIFKYRAHHAAQGLLGQDVISDVVDGHGGSILVLIRRFKPSLNLTRHTPGASALPAMFAAIRQFRWAAAARFPVSKRLLGSPPTRLLQYGRWRLLLPVASEPRLPELNPSGL